MRNQPLVRVLRYPQIYKKIICDAGPIAGVSAVATLTEFLITMILATEGLTALAAFSFLTLFGELVSVCVGELLLVATSSIGLAGEGDAGLKKSRRMLYNTALMTGMIVGLLVLLSIWTAPFLKAIGQSHPVADLTGEYLPIFVLASGFRLISRMIEDLYIMHEKSYQALVISLFDQILVCLVTFLSTKHRFLKDTTGLSGFVYGSLCSNIFILFVLTLHSRYYHRFPEMIGIWRQKLSKRDLQEVLQFGGPMIFQQLIEMGSTTAGSMMMGMISVKAVVARHIANEYTMNLAVPVPAFSDAASLLVSQQLGKGRLINAYKLAVATMSLASMLPLGLLGISCFIDPTWVIAPFKTGSIDNNTAHMAYAFIQLQLGMLVLDGLRYPLVSTLRSYRDTLGPCLWTFLTMALVGPCFSYFSGVKQHVPQYVLWGEVLGIFLGLIYIMPRWRKVAVKHLEIADTDLQHLRASTLLTCATGSAFHPEVVYRDPDTMPACFQEEELEEDSDDDETEQHVPLTTPDV